MQALESPFRVGINVLSKSKKIVVIWLGLKIFFVNLFILFDAIKIFF